MPVGGKVLFRHMVNLPVRLGGLEVINFFVHIIIWTYRIA